MDSPFGFPGAFLFHFCGYYVPGKADPGQTGMDGKIKAAKTNGLMSYQHSWFYPDLSRDPPDNSCRAGKVKIESDSGLY